MSENTSKFLTKDDMEFIDEMGNREVQDEGSLEHDLEDMERVINSIKKISEVPLESL